MAPKDQKYLLYRALPLRLAIYLIVATLIIVAEHVALIWFLPDIANNLALHQFEGEQIARNLRTFEYAKNTALMITGGGLVLWAVVLFFRPVIELLRRLWRLTRAVIH